MAVEEAIVLVGGLGTRLRAVVSNVPKPLAPVAGRPFLAWVLDRLADVGMRRVILATGYMAERVEDVVGRRWQGMVVDYSIEDTPLGTGGAVRLAATRLQGEGAHVLNGDTYLSYIPEMLEQATLAAGATLGVALAQVPDVGRYGAVEITNGRVSAFREKGLKGAGMVNAGCYFLTARALAALPKSGRFSLETDVLLPRSAMGEVAAFGKTANFIDIGVPDDYARAQALFGMGNL